MVNHGQHIVITGPDYLERTRWTGQSGVVLSGPDSEGDLAIEVIEEGARVTRHFPPSSISSINHRDGATVLVPAKSKHATHRHIVIKNPAKMWSPTPRKDTPDATK